jgi:hypothetical protein
MTGVRRFAVPAVTFAAGVLLASGVAYAATGVFSSSTTTPAVKATNTGGGYAVDALSTNSGAEKAESRGNKSVSTLYLRSLATGELANGLYAKSYPTSGEHYGVWGVNNSFGGAGVRGQGAGTGVLGETGGVPGDATFGVWSEQDLVNNGHLVTLDTDLSTPGNLAGTCTVPAGATQVTCTFDDPFFTVEFAEVTPIVVLTPRQVAAAGLPAYSVLSANQDGFTISLASAAPAGGLQFGYHVVGVNEIEQGVAGLREQVAGARR